MAPAPVFMLQLEERGDSVRFAVRVVPRASRDAVVGVLDGALKVALTAPPVEGEANAALVALLARALGVPRRDVTLVRGDASRSKQIEVRGATADAVRALVPDAPSGPLPPTDVRGPGRRARSR